MGIIVAVISVVILVTTLIVLILNRPQTVLPVPVPYDGTLKHTQGYDGAVLSLYFHSNKTLFNCNVTIRYTANNGTNVQIDKQIGIVDVNAMSLWYGFSLNDYPWSADNQSSTIQFNDTVPLETLTINATGSTNP